MKVFITGASSGIGEALARHYAAEGCTLGLFARRESELARVAASIRPATVSTYAGDVRDAEALARAAGRFVGSFGAPDVVIANAGISTGTLTDFAVDTEVFRSVLETNVLGIVNTFQPFIASMRATGTGTLVGIASVAGFRGLPGAGAYSASKAAAIRYLESLRIELRSSGIAVVTICPGYVDTPMTVDNPYPMPFILRPDVAARSIARSIARRKRFSVLPWQVALGSVLLRALPRPLYDRIFAAVPRKPRGLR